MIPTVWRRRLFPRFFTSWREMRSIQKSAIAKSWCGRGKRKIELIDFQNWENDLAALTWPVPCGRSPRTEARDVTHACHTGGERGSTASLSPRPRVSREALPRGHLGSGPIRRWVGEEATSKPARTVVARIHLLLGARAEGLILLLAVGPRSPLDPGHVGLIYMAARFITPSRGKSDWGESASWKLNLF